MSGRAVLRSAHDPALHRVELDTGMIEVAVDRAAWPLEQVCGFGARDNPQRGFLVVSKLLGRHIGAAPDVMRRAAADLAAAIPADLPGPVLVVGLAETAICLGQTLHRELRALTGRDDIFFIHSTRQRIDHPLLCRFEEPHSHASAHLIYRPDIEGFSSPRSLVLVDDELSTGTTIANLAHALVDYWPSIRTIHLAALADWSRGAALHRMPRPAQSVALIEGQLRWTPAAVQPRTSGFAQRAASLGRLDTHRNLGRLGLRTPLVLELPPPPPGTAPLRVLGTGECSYPAFLLAEAWQQAGRDVIVQATSRSPARLGGAIASKLCFADNYRTGVPNFLYNADLGDGRETWIVQETGAASVDPVLVRALGAHVLAWPV